MTIEAITGDNIIDYRFRTKLFGGQVLQVGYTQLLWDTNTGMDIDLSTKYRDATEKEAEEFLIRGKDNE